MQPISRQLLNAFGLAMMGVIALSPTAKAVEFRVTTVQVRSGEVVEIEDITQNFRTRQRDQLSNQSFDTVGSLKQRQAEAATAENQVALPSAIAGR
ncbi:hypothetical protein S7335_3481 [Synechococcus sp. PCC 7335]|uniref:hypothetical protein n=1 Tax=Synechococcus sp. (strain ATCC 29403 / PCC 7335) TaxID=91464 RepID=UPI00017ECAFA|nr:hypothetical protein [Synechococcus sp. PCC 7335]EDX85778.1 hypothetical protein S7335_3481 [Synechococcus sp. PCC 7335]